MARAKKNNRIVSELEKENEVKSSTEMETMAPETKTGTVAYTVAANIREHPSLEANIVDCLLRGDKVLIHYKTTNGFYKITSVRINKSGFILSSLIKED